MLYCFVYIIIFILFKFFVIDVQLVKMMGIFIVWYIIFFCGYQNFISFINREKYKYQNLGQFEELSW